MIWAKTDFTERNGVTRVIPGSHRFEDGLQFNETDTIPAEMSKGSVLFYADSVYQGANRSSGTRTGLVIIDNL